MRTRTLTLMLLSCALAMRNAAAEPAADHCCGPWSSGGESSSRDETLVDSHIDHGGYGGPRIGYTRIAGSDAMWVGGEGGWIINHHIIIGGAGYGLVTQQPAPGALAATDDLSLGYGGLLLKYTVLPHHLVHATFGTLIGAGGVGSHPRSGGDSRGGADSFFVLEPDAAVELNVVEHVRAGLALSYRWVTGVQKAGLGNGDLSGFTSSLVLKFGKF